MDDVKPSTVEERLIARIWAQILHVPEGDLGIGTNFFRAGGTSLTAVVVSRKLSKEFGTEVNVTEIFQHQTIKKLAAALVLSAGSLPPPSATPLPYLPGGVDVISPGVFLSLQLIGIAFMTFIVAAPLAAAVSITVRIYIAFDRWISVCLLPTIFLGGCLFHMLLVLACKWLIIGRYQPGRAKLWSFYFLKWWLLRRLYAVTTLYSWMFDETPFAATWLWLFGMHVGSNVTMEKPLVFEPDLVTIGSGCDLGYETEFASAEIAGGFLWLRSISIGENVKVGTRAAFLGGACIHANCEVKPKSAVDHSCGSQVPRQVLEGAPAKVTGTVPEGFVWRENHGWCYHVVQVVVGVFLLLAYVELSFIAAVEIGIQIQNLGGAWLVAYLGTLFLPISLVSFLLLVLCTHNLLIPNLVPGKEYSGPSFHFRRWLVDRLLLSPLFEYASRRLLQTSSTLPIALRLLGANIGKKAWMNHPHFRVGIQLLRVGEEAHMGMESYFTTARTTSTGTVFEPIEMGDHVSVGQRVVMVGGTTLGDDATVGADTIVSRGFNLNSGGSTFGSPAVVFSTSASNAEVVSQTQGLAQRMQLQRQNSTAARHLKRKGYSQPLSKKSSSNFSTLVSSDAAQATTESGSNLNPGRAQDIGEGRFFTYVFLTLTIQLMMPVLVGSCYGGIYYAISLLLKTYIDEDDATFKLIAQIGSLPVIYFIGSITLVFMLKLIQMCGLGSFQVGQTSFFSWRFFFWHIFADLVYFCTTSIMYPFSGTFLYCWWLRFMGAKIGKRVFISPEGGGFRELDFMDIGDDAVLLTPHIHAHYTDHGRLQFAPIKIGKNAVVNYGASIMPLTKYGEGCHLRPFANTVKGQECNAKSGYWGNPCVKAPKSPMVALLFPGQGAQYPGMFEALLRYPVAVQIIERANKILEFDVVEAAGPTVDPKVLSETQVAQPVLFVAEIAIAAVLREMRPGELGSVAVCAGFSLGELAALCIAGCVSFEDALRLVQIRGKSMQACAVGGGMLTVRGMVRADVEHVGQVFGCQIANVIADHASPSLVDRNIFVLGGTAEEVKNLTASESHAKVLRAVSGAFHTRHMHPAKKAFRKALKSTKLTMPSTCLLYSNVTGKPYTSVKQMRNLLVEQLVSPVQWHPSIQHMKEVEGITEFIECGPMQQLKKMMDAIDPESKIVSSTDLITPV
jgi:[acyl-carrier-protein] S-malonyltransferase